MEYEQLLERARDQLPEKLFEKTRFKVPKADSFIQGNRTVLRNFMDIAKALNRDPHHFMKFLLRELATAGDIEGSRAIFQGRFDYNLVNGKLKSYLEEFVFCEDCGKPDTKLEKQRGVIIMKCMACGARHPKRRL
jgi:translation initiation factor 2 subunit 2